LKDKLDELAQVVGAIKKDMETQAALGSQQTSSPAVYGLGGIILGMVGAVILVGFINKSNAAKRRQRGGSGSSLLKGEKGPDFEQMEMNSMDDEKLH
jgi:hypothetical protein